MERIQQTRSVVRILQPGPPDVLRYETGPLLPPAAGEIVIDQKFIGVNFLDVFFRNGTFPVPSYPALIGIEAAGIVTQAGSAVTGFNIGDRIAYYGSTGAYADKRVMSSEEIFRLPDDITFEQAASVMVKGLTARMLVKDSHQVKPGEVILIHAITGGVGTLLSAWVKHIGARVIGTVGNSRKKDMALQRGYTDVIDLSSEDLASAVNTLTEGKGVDAVYDGTGKATFEQSVGLVKKGGSAVLYGWPSGMPVIDPQFIADRHINFVRAVLNNDPAYQDRKGEALKEIFDLVRDKVFTIEHPAVYLLKEATKAHNDLESRKTTGSILLKP